MVSNCCLLVAGACPLCDHKSTYFITAGVCFVQVEELKPQVAALDADRAEKAAALGELQAEHQTAVAAAAKSGAEAADREAQLAAQLTALQERLDTLTKEAETAQAYQQELEGTQYSLLQPPLVWVNCNAQTRSHPSLGVFSRRPGT